jgi:hypothetical protein
MFAEITGVTTTDGGGAAANAGDSNADAPNASAAPTTLFVTRAEMEKFKLAPLEKLRRRDWCQRHGLGRLPPSFPRKRDSAPAGCLGQIKSRLRGNDGCVEGQSLNQFVQDSLNNR